MRRLIASYFEQTTRYGTRRFIIEMLIVAFILKGLIGVIAGLLFELFGIDQLPQTTTELTAQQGLVMLIVAALIIAPPLETLIGQWLPIALVGIFSRSPLKKVVGSALFFSAQHLYAGFFGLITTFPLAVVLAWSFVLHRRHSRWRACWVTTAIHFWHNAIAILVYLLAGGPA